MNKGRKKDRNLQAIERQKKYDKLSVQQKIAKAKKSIGASAKELKKLYKKLKEKKNVKS